MDQHLSIDGEVSDWLMRLKGVIRNANLTFTNKFLWLIVRHCLFPTAADNIVTWDRVVLMAAVMAGFEVDVAGLLQAVIHEMAFRLPLLTLFSACYFYYEGPQVCPSCTLISSRLRKAILISASSGMRPMSWLHPEGLVPRCLHFVRIWLIL